MNSFSYKLTLDLNFCSSVFVIVSAFAMTGMMLTFESSFFIVTKSRAFILSANTTSRLLVILTEMIMNNISHNTNQNTNETVTSE